MPSPERELARVSANPATDRVPLCRLSRRAPHLCRSLSRFRSQRARHRRRPDFYSAIAELFISVIETTKSRLSNFPTGDIGFALKIRRLVAAGTRLTHFQFRNRADSADTGINVLCFFFAGSHARAISSVLFVRRGNARRIEAMSKNIQASRMRLRPMKQGMR